MSFKINLSPKTKKILNIVVDVFCGIILIVALIFAICSISSKAKGYDQYTEIFGKSYLAVQSESMEKDYSTGEVKDDNFSKGDLIVIKTLKVDEVRKLKVGDIVTFQTRDITDDGTMVLNSHRIIEIVGTEGEASAFITHGDNNPEGRNETVLVSDVVGIYQGKASGIGHMFLFMGTSAGFFVCVVLPTLIVVAFAAVNLVLVILKEKKVQAVASEEAKQSEREKMRAELLAEMGMNAENKQEHPELAKEENTSEQLDTAENENASKQENVSEQEESSDGAENTK